MSELWEIIVGPGEPLPGIKVVGFHGTVNPQRTPARKAPVLLDETGAMVRLVPPFVPVADAEGAQVRVQVERGESQGPSGELPGYGTPFGPLQARFRYTIIALGEDERLIAPLLCAQATGDEPATVTEFAMWLARGCQPPHPAGAQEVGRLVVWYCSEPDAYTLWQRIQEKIRRALFEAVARKQQAEMIRLGWWLSRAAYTDEDLYLAGSALMSGGSSDAEPMLRAMLRELPKSAELRKRLRQALQQLEECAKIAAVAVQTSSKSSPVLAGHRKAARQQLGLIESRAVNS